MLRNNAQFPWLRMLRNILSQGGKICYVTSSAKWLKRECNGEIVGEIMNHSGDFTAALSGGQFYPQLGEHFLFKPCASVDPFFISWALNGHRTRIESGAKHQHYKCAGCLICSESCGFTARPRTCSAKEQYCGNVRKHGGRNVVVILQTCQVEFQPGE
jgi:hypothetical protein